jgi:hypothetical protein
LDNLDTCLIDSGGFTLKKTKEGKEWNQEYFDGYLRFIEEWADHPKIRGFFEYDAISDLGQRTLVHDEMNKRSEGKTIPIWTVLDSPKYFVKLSKEYDIVSYSQVFSKLPPDIIKSLAGTAHKHGAKLHALGAVSKRVYHAGVDSGDSTSWAAVLQGRRNNLPALPFKKLLGDGFEKKSKDPGVPLSVAGAMTTLWRQEYEKE